MPSPASRCLPASPARSAGRPAPFHAMRFGWRGACLAWAALHLLLGLPLNRLLVPQGTGGGDTQAAARGRPPRPWTMIVLAGVFGATWFVSTAMAAHLPRLLEALGPRRQPRGLRRLPGRPGPGRRPADRVQLAAAGVSLFSARLATALHPIARGAAGTYRRQPRPYRSCCCMAAETGC